MWTVNIDDVSVDMDTVNFTVTFSNGDRSLTDSFTVDSQNDIKGCITRLIAERLKKLSTADTVMATVETLKDATMSVEDTELTLAK